MPARVACQRSANVFGESSPNASNYIVKASAQILRDQTIMPANLWILWSAIANVRAKYPGQDAYFLTGQMVAWRAKVKRSSGARTGVPMTPGRMTPGFTPGSSRHNKKYPKSILRTGDG